MSMKGNCRDVYGKMEFRNLYKINFKNQVSGLKPLCSSQVNNMILTCIAWVTTMPTIINSWQNQYGWNFYGMVEDMEYMALRTENSIDFYLEGNAWYSYSPDEGIVCK